MSISVILTVYNKENLIQQVVNSILCNISEMTKEFIVVLDGCTDNSEKYLHDCLKDFNTEDLKVKIIKTDDVYETRANNAGLKASNCDFSIIFQDDMVVKEKNFDKRIITPLLIYDDLFAITARNAHGIFIKNDEIDWCDVVGGPVGDKFDNSYRIPSDFDRETLYVRMTINRGPMAFDNKKLKLLNYFDETLPGVIHCDDHDLCLRARIKHNWKCGAFWIWYESKNEWGSTRNQSTEKSKFLDEQEQKNKKELYNRYKDVIPKLNISEIRKINRI